MSTAVEALTQEAPPEFITRGDHVRLSKNDVIPSRYRGTVGEVSTVFSSGKIGVIVPRRKAPITLERSEIDKVGYDASRVFKAR